MTLMSAVETTTLGWKLSKLQQKISEQLELIARKFTENAGDLPLPSLDARIVIVIIKLLFWLIVAGLLIWITLKILRWVKFYLKSERRKFKNPLASRTVNSSSPEWSITHWVKQAQKFQQQENYYEACQCLYQAMLQTLHNQGIAPHQASRTDGEYGKLIASLIQPEPYQQLLQIHQELCFGNVSASLSLLETCWSAYGEIEKT